MKRTTCSRLGLAAALLAGVNYWLHPDVALKADVQMQDNDVSKNDNGYNLGRGYRFQSVCRQLNQAQYGAPSRPVSAS